LKRWLFHALSLASIGAAAVFFARGRWLVALGWAGLSLIPLGLLLPRGRRAWFAVAAIALSVVATLAFVLGIDLYLHYKFARPAATTSGATADLSSARNGPANNGWSCSAAAWRSGTACRPIRRFPLSGTTPERSTGRAPDLGRQCRVEQRRRILVPVHAA